MRFGTAESSFRSGNCPGRVYRFAGPRVGVFGIKALTQGQPERADWTPERADQTSDAPHAGAYARHVPGRERLLSTTMRNSTESTAACSAPKPEQWSDGDHHSTRTIITPSPRYPTGLLGVFLHFHRHRIRRRRQPIKHLILFIQFRPHSMPDLAYPREIRADLVQ